MYLFDFYKAFIISFVRCETIAKDIFQEALFTVVKNKKPFVEPIIYRAIRWRLIDYFRTIKTNPEQNINFWDEIRQFEEPSVKDNDLLNLVIKDAPGSIKMHLEGYKLKEIAKLENTNINTIKSRHYRFIKKSQKFYKDFPDII